MANVMFKFGLQSAYESAAKQTDALYFITDTQRIYKGSDLIADVTPSNVEFTTTEPQFATADANKLYVYTDTSGNTTILVKGTDSMVTVSGGELEDGSITFSKLNTDAVTTSSELTSGELPDSDTTLPTAAAVKDAIETAIAGVTSTSLGLDDAITGVSSTPNSTDGETGVILTFTRKSGQNPIEVKIADLFLSNATYDSVSHDLTLTLNDGSTVVVNLEDLIPETTAFSNVEVGEGNDFEVNLGSGVGLGGFSAGDEIPSNMTLAEFAKKLLTKRVLPIYTNPTVSITRSGGTASGNVEIGTNVSVSLNSTFTQNDAGTLTNIQFKKGSNNVGEASSSSPASYTESINNFDTSVSYTAVATYEQGPVKNDNLNQPSVEGQNGTSQIKAGSVTSSTISFNPYRKGFYGAVNSKAATVDSAFVRSLPSSTTSAPANGNTWTIQIPVGALRVAFAYPATLRDVTSVKDVNGLNAEIKTSFTKSTVSVEGANGYSGIEYKVYVADFANPIETANSYTVQI